MTVIKFEFDNSKTNINFLDTAIQFDDTNNLESTLYVKENDICTLLHSDSYHPENCKGGIIYCQALRYRRIITNNSDLKNHLYSLKTNLLKRGYHIATIEHEFHKVKSLSQIGYCNPRVTRSCNRQVTISAVGGRAAIAASIPTPAGL